MRLIQTTGKKQSDAVAGTTVTHNFAANLIPGSDVYLAVSHYGNNTTNVISGITIGGTAAVRTVQKRDTPQFNNVEIWKASNVTGGSSSIAFTFGSTGHYITFGAEEWRGTGAADQTGSGGPTSSAAPTPTAAGATAQADELIYAAFCDTVGTSWTSSTPPTGYTEAFEEPLGTSHEAGSSAFNRLTSIATPAPAFATGASMTWIAALATYRAYGPNHSLNYHFVSAGGSTITTAAMTFDTAASGSTMLVCTGRGDVTLNTSSAISDNKSNSYPRQTVNGSTTKTYTLWPSSGTALYACAGFTGGSGHTVTATKGNVNDETTICAVEVLGTIIQDMQWNEDTTGPTNQSATVTYTNDATLVCFWSGDDGGGEANPAVAAGWQKLEWTSSVISNHVQFAVAMKKVTGSGTDSCLWTPSTSQGAQMYIIAVQQAAGGDPLMGQACY